MIQVPEHLLPPGDDLHQDTLPVEQHPSYPLGNPYWIHHAPQTLQPEGSSQPKLDPRTHAHDALHLPRDALPETLSCVSHGSALAQAALDVDADDVPVSAYSIDDHRVVLAPYLQLRAQTTTTVAPPTWPFPHYGPGPCARPHSALFADRAEGQPEVSVWADLALEELAPRPRPDSYSLPSSLVHPYTQSTLRGKKRERPSGLPDTLGAATKQRDDAWLDHDEPAEPDGSFERELEACTAIERAASPRRARHGSSGATLRSAILRVLAPRDGAAPRAKRARSTTSPDRTRLRRSLDPQGTSSTAPRAWVWGVSAPRTLDPPP